MKTEQSRELKEIGCLYRELDEIYHEIALKSGLSDSAFTILYAMMELGDGCLQKDIADRYYVSRQTVNSSIQKLLAKGYITLKQGKGRDMHIYLTSAGQRLMEEKVEPVIKLENSVFEEMTSEDSSEFLRLTQKYVSLYRKKMMLL